MPPLARSISDSAWAEVTKPTRATTVNSANARRVVFLAVFIVIFFLLWLVVCRGSRSADTAVRSGTCDPEVFAMRDNCPYFVTMLILKVRNMSSDLTISGVCATFMAVSRRPLRRDKRS